MLYYIPYVESLGMEEFPVNKRPPLRRSAPVETENDGIIEGRNAVIEALNNAVILRFLALLWDTLRPLRGNRALWWWTPTGVSWTA